MDPRDRLEGKRILIVDDEQDILDTLHDLLRMCRITKATTFEEARNHLNAQHFDMAILDIMGVDGYELLKLAQQKKVIAVMLTAHAMSPENITRSFDEGAASFVPKEEMSRIGTFLSDILEAKEKGKSFWWRWYDRLAEYFERKFGPDWQKKHRIHVR